MKPESIEFSSLLEIVQDDNLIAEIIQDDNLIAVKGTFDLDNIVKVEEIYNKRDALNSLAQTIERSVNICVKLNAKKYNKGIDRNVYLLAAIEGFKSRNFKLPTIDVPMIIQGLTGRFIHDMICLLISAVPIFAFSQQELSDAMTFSNPEISPSGVVDSVSLAVLAHLCTPKALADSQIYKNAFANAIKIKNADISEGMKKGFIKKNGFSINASTVWFDQFSQIHLSLLMVDPMINSELRSLRQSNSHGGQAPSLEGLDRDILAQHYVESSFMELNKQRASAKMLLFGIMASSDAQSAAIVRSLIKNKDETKKRRIHMMYLFLKQIRHFASLNQYDIGQFNGFCTTIVGSSTYLTKMSMYSDAMLLDIQRVIFDNMYINVEQSSQPDQDRLSDSFSIHQKKRDDWYLSLVTNERVALTHAGMQSYINREKVTYENSVLI